MNYFRHHIGDYDSATAHLSWLEDMAYTRLMRLYYRRELPIPADLSQACRLLRATSKQEREAVTTVLSEFFILADDGWHNARCDEEIGLAQEKAQTNRTVGKLGGRPRKTETQTVSENNPNGFQEETQTVSENNPSHKPLAISQESSKETSKEKRGATASRLPPTWKATDENLAFCRTERPDLDPLVVEAKFRDHFLAASGAKARMVDWTAAWRNFVRREFPQRGASHAAHQRIDNSAVARVERATAHLYASGTKRAHDGGPLAPDDADLRPPLDVGVRRDG